MTVKVACCQMELNVEEPGKTWDHIAAACEQAAQEGADLIVFPELANSGYVFDSLEEAERLATVIPGPFADQLAELSDRFANVIVCGINERSGGKLYSSALVVDRGQLAGIYRKSHLWNTEHNFFVAANDPPLVVDTSIGVLGVAVCYDVEFPEIVRLAAEEGAELMAVPVNWPLLPRPRNVWPIEIAKVMAHASEYQVPIAIADRCGEERGVKWIGGSCIIDRSGYPAAMPQLDEPSTARIITADIRLSPDKQISPFNHALTDRRVDIYSDKHTPETAITEE